MLSSPVWRGGPEAALGAGLVIGGLASAVVALIAGSLIRWAAFGFGWAVVFGACAVLLLREFDVLRFRLPQNARLIPQTVFRHGRYLGSFEFGFELGSGVRTYVTSSLPYALLIAVAVVSGPAQAAAAGAGFGLGRLAMTMMAVRHDDEDGADGGRSSWSDAWDDSNRPLQSVLALCFVGLLAAASVAG